MDCTNRFIRVSSRVINEQHNFIDFRYSKNHTIVEQKKYMQLLLLEKKIDLLQNQLFLIREGLGSTLFARIKHQLNILDVKIVRLKKKYR